MERRDRDRDRDHHRDRDRDRHHRSDRDRDRRRERSRSRRRSSSRSRYDRERDRDRRRSRSNSSSRHRRSPHQSRSKKDDRRSDREKSERQDTIKKSTPPPPCISMMDTVPSCSSNTLRKEQFPVKQSSPDVISQLEKHNKKPGAYCNLKPDEPIDKEKIHKDIEEKLRETLAREGIEYNAPKPEATHPVFANDGSFLEIFKKMQEAQQESTKPTEPPSTSYAPPMLATSNGTVPVPRPQLPIFGRRRGGKILKTGVVAKPKSTENDSNADPKDFWSIYLREVNKYKNAACDSDAQSRPLVK